MAMPSAEDPDEDAVWANYVPGEDETQVYEPLMTWSRSLTASLCMWPIGPAESSIQSKGGKMGSQGFTIGHKAMGCQSKAALMAALVQALAAFALCTPSSQSRRPRGKGRPQKQHVFCVRQ